MKVVGKMGLYWLILPRIFNMHGTAMTRTFFNTVAKPGRRKTSWKSAAFGWFEKVAPIWKCSRKWIPNGKF